MEFQRCSVQRCSWKFRKPQVIFCKFCEIFKNIFFIDHLRCCFWKANSRSSRPEMFCKKRVLRNFAKFTGKHFLGESLFYSLRPENLLRWSLWHRWFPVNFVNSFKNTLFYRTSSLVTSVKACNFTKIRLRQGYFMNFLKIYKKRFFDELQEFSKSSQKYWRENVCKISLCR